MIDGVSDAA